MKRRPALLFLPFLTALAAGAQVRPDTTTRPAHIASGIRAVPAAHAGGAGANYVRTWTATKPYTDTADVVSGSRTVQEVKQATQYLDGLGRPMQSVARQASPSGNDMVSMNLYDEFGREAYKYLPYAAIDSNTDNGLFKRDPFREQASFLGNATYSPGLVGEQVYYGRTLFEASPLNRPVASYAPGNSWGGSNVGTAMGYAINTAADSVRIWDIAATIGATPTTSGCYAAGELYKNTVTDEHGKQVVEYRDKDGHAILKKVQLSATPSAHHTGWFCTYYVYDDFGLLRFVVQPKAVEAIQGGGLWSISSTVRDELCFWYAYDSRNRMIVKKVPGAGQVQMVYDLRDRLIYTQDANLRPSFRWLKTVYDSLNRPVQTWLAQNFCGRSALQSNEDAGGGSACGSPDPEPDGFYFASDTLLTETYYDNYDWASGSGSGLSSSFIGTYASNTSYFYAPSNTTWPYPQTIAATAAVRGMATGSRVRVLGTSTFLYTSTFYDDRGRTVQTHSTNYSGGKDTVTVQYGFDGKLLRTLACQAKAGTNAQRYVTLTKMEYDAMGRLTKTYKKVNGSPEVLLTENSYDETGQLKQKKLGQQRDNANWNTYTTGAMDSLNYSYNIRGWLRGINADYARNENGAVNWFGMEICYDHGFSTAQLNGNIAGTRWRSRGHDEERAYGFAYDAANRLLEGDFTQKASSSWNTSAGVDYTMKIGDGSDPATAYDANGNILKMWQRGLALGGSITIDSMAYAYGSGSNKLARVTDGIPSPSGGAGMGDFNDGTNTGDDYAYDANGNMYTDWNKGISSITYNHLNLPQEIRVLGKGRITYTYDATGNKLQKQTVDSTGSTVRTTTALYLGGTVYRNDTLEYMAHEEGRMRPGNNNADTVYYEYFEKDHLGNVRAVITDERKKDVYHAGFEDAGATFEGQLFQNYGNRVAKPACFGSDGDRVHIVGAPLVERRGTTVQAVVGTGKVLKVMAGDRVDVTVRAMFSTGSNGVSPTTLTPLQDLVVALFTGGIVNTNTGAGHGSFTTGSGALLSGGIADFLSTQDNYSGSKAYLNWVLLDGEQFGLVSSGSGFESVIDGTAGLSTGEECNPTITLQANEGAGIDITRNGYLYVYVSNTSTDHPVYFDELHIEHTRGPLVEETQYYPFGLAMAGISSKAATNAPANRMKYNGKEEQNKEFSDGSGLELYDYSARMYDPQTGHFPTQDPHADKYTSVSPYAYGFDNPIIMVDPTGKDNVIYLEAQDESVKRSDLRKMARAANRNFENMGLRTTVKLAKKGSHVDLAKIDATDALALIGKASNVYKRVDGIMESGVSTGVEYNFKNQMVNNHFGVDGNVAVSDGKLIIISSEGLEGFSGKLKLDVAETGGLTINHEAGHDAGLDHSGGFVRIYGEGMVEVPKNSVMSGAPQWVDAANQGKNVVNQFINTTNNTMSKYGQGNTSPIYKAFIQRFGSNAAKAKLPTE